MNRPRHIKHILSHCSKLTELGVAVLDSDSDQDEELIYSQESPKSLKVCKDFDWDLDKFVYCKSPI